MYSHPSNLTTFQQYFYTLRVRIHPLFALISYRWLSDVGRCQEFARALHSANTTWHSQRCTRSG